MNETYLTVVETAKLIRKQLKKRFPGQKFSVRSKSYSGGASITIYWTDGPTGSEVDAVVKAFEGRGFDGMIDLAYSKSSWLLPDGSVQFANSGGTEGSRGTVPSYDNPEPVSGAQLVNFGANYVFTTRSFSKKFLEKVAKTFSKETGWSIPEITVSTYDESANFARTDETIPGGMHYQTLDREYFHEAHQTSAFVKVEPKPIVVEKSDPPKDYDRDGYVVAHEGDWTWIAFQEKPVAQVLTALRKVFKARWSNGRKSWYIMRWVGREEVATCIQNALAAT